MKNINGKTPLDLSQETILEIISKHVAETKRKDYFKNCIFIISFGRVQSAMFYLLRRWAWPLFLLALFVAFVGGKEEDGGLSREKRSKSCSQLGQFSVDFG